MPNINEPIQLIHSVNELFEFFGFEIENQNIDEILAKNSVSE